MFDAAGVTPLEAAHARFHRDALEEAGDDAEDGELRADLDVGLADLWDEADAAADAACGVGWANPPADPEWD